METFFNPKTIAVIGVSSKPNKIGRMVFDTLLAKKKKAYPINPNLELVSGIKCYPSLTELMKDVKKIDVIVVAVPVEPTVEVMEEAGKLGIKRAIIVSAGFKEVGNYEADKKLEDICKKHNIKVIGPNCLGILDTYTNFDCVFNPPDRLERPKKGGITFLTQSGATGAVILDRISSLGVSKFISYGNAMNLNESDFLEYLDKDRTTKIICIYIEGVKDGKRFLKVCSKIKKPIVVLKGGKTTEGSKAAISHTGSLAGDAVIYSGIFKQLNIIEVDGVEQMISVLNLLNSDIKGKTVGVITNGGGYGIISVDHLLKSNIEFKGPVVDLLGGSTSEGYRDAINNMKTDIILCNLLFQTPLLDDAIIKVLIDLSKKRNIIVISTGSKYTEDRVNILKEKGVCVINTPEKAVDALRLILKK